MNTVSQDISLIVERMKTLFFNCQRLYYVVDGAEKLKPTGSGRLAFENVQKLFVTHALFTYDFLTPFTLIFDCFGLSGTSRL